MQSISARSFLRLGTDASDWHVVVSELEGDDSDPRSALKTVASRLDPVVLERTGLHLRENEMAV